ncbi:MAG: phosphatase PAP2 family protein, partial [Bdellovibrionota bacterium]
SRGTGFQWGEHYHEFNWAEMAFLAPAAAGVGLLFAPSPTTPNWTAHNGPDETARNGLLAPPGMRGQLDSASTGIVVGLAAYAFLIDGGLVVGIVNKDAKGMARLWGSQAESASVGILIMEAFKDGVARERPYMRLCLLGTTDPACTASDRYQSFLSGHTLFAVQTAVQICTNHLDGHLYGNKAGDIMACIGASLAATGVGFMRISADKHYMSDVLVGAGFGVITGIIPWLIHNIWHKETQLSVTARRDKKITFDFGVGDVPGGLTLKLMGQWGGAAGP